MGFPFTVSIVVCTRNRAPALAKTLTSFQKFVLPPGWAVETVVVDNASSDETATVVEHHSKSLQALNVRYVLEPRRGKGYALNRGLATAKGQVLLFTDDDVVPARDWVERLAVPLLAGEADAAGGRVLLGPELSRSWLTENYQRWLAWYDYPLTDPIELVGANMGVSRTVLEQVPWFDPELGPGAAGLGEDTLFGWRVAASGLKIKFVREAVVMHHPDPSRLQRASWLAMAQSHGRKDAYILHHWKHASLPYPLLRLVWLQVKLAVRRRISPPRPLDSEGCAPWEMSYVGDIEMCRAYRRERTKPRNYPKGTTPQPSSTSVIGT